MLSIKGLLRRIVLGTDLILVPRTEWEKVQNLIRSFEPGGFYEIILREWRAYRNEFSPEYIARIKRLAEEAHLAAINALPISKVLVAKVEGAVVVSGFPEDPDPTKYMTKS